MIVAFKLEFLDTVHADTYDVIRVRENDEEKAIALIRAHEEHGPTELRGD